MAAACDGQSQRERERERLLLEKGEGLMEGKDKCFSLIALLRTYHKGWRGMTYLIRTHLIETYADLANNTEEFI